MGCAASWLLREKGPYGLCNGRSASAGAVELPFVTGLAQFVPDRVVHPRTISTTRGGSNDATLPAVVRVRGDAALRRGSAAASPVRAARSGGTLEAERGDERRASAPARRIDDAGARRRRGARCRAAKPYDCRARSGARRGRQECLAGGAARRGHAEDRAERPHADA